MLGAISLKNRHNITGIGLSYVEASEDDVSDRNYLVTDLLALEDIYNTRRNYSEVVTNYVYTNDNQTVLNISAVNQGREEGLPITFDSAALVLFVRFLGEASRGRTYRWCKFYCQFSWQQESGESEAFIVAEGNFTAAAYLPFLVSSTRDVQ